MENAVFILRGTWNMLYQMAYSLFRVRLYWHIGSKAVIMPLLVIAGVLYLIGRMFRKRGGLK